MHMQAACTIWEKEARSPINSIGSREETFFLPLPAKVWENLVNITYCFPPLALRDEVDIGHFVLSRCDRSQPQLIQKFLKGGEVRLEHVKDFAIARIFVRRSKLSPVVKKTVSLNLNNSTIVM